MDELSTVKQLFANAVSLIDAVPSYVEIVCIRRQISYRQLARELGITGKSAKNLTVMPTDRLSAMLVIKATKWLSENAQYLIEDTDNGQH
jgi:hypothetical protein